MLEDLGRNIESVLSHAVISLCLYTLTGSNTEGYTYALIIVAVFIMKVLPLCEELCKNNTKTYKFIMQSFYSFVSVVTSYISYKILKTNGVQLFSFANLTRFMYALLIPINIISFIAMAILLISFCKKKDELMVFVIIMLGGILTVLLTLIVFLKMLQITIIQIFFDTTTFCILAFALFLVTVSLKNKDNRNIFPCFLTLILNLNCMLARCMWIRELESHVEINV